MIEGIYVAASGGYKQEKSLEVISNNLANVNTIGFKRDVLAFKSFMTPFQKSFKKESPGLLPATSAQIKDASYTGIVELKSDLSPGRITATGNPLDVALDGEGFFVVQTKDGVRYTKQGNFKLNNNKILVTQNGDPLIGTGGPITIKSSGPELSIDIKGKISVGKGLSGEVAGNLRIVNFNNPEKLIKSGNGLFMLTGKNSEEIEATNFSIKQGYLELSNVNIIKEMTKMIEVSRTYQAYQQVIQTIDSVNAKAAIDFGRFA